MFNLKNATVLTRAQQKNVKGGAADGIGTCAYQWHGMVVINANRETARRYAAEYGGHWCCDNCGSASWMQ